MNKPDLGDFRRLCDLSGVTFFGVWFDTDERVGLAFSTDDLGRLTVFGNHCARAGFNLTPMGVYPTRSGERFFAVFPVERFAVEAYPESLRAMGWDPVTGKRMGTQP